MAPRTTSESISRSLAMDCANSSSSGRPNSGIAFTFCYFWSPGTRITRTPDKPNTLENSPAREPDSMVKSARQPGQWRPEIPAQTPQEGKVIPRPSRRTGANGGCRLSRRHTTKLLRRRSRNVRNHTIQCSYLGSTASQGPRDAWWPVSGQSPPRFQDARSSQLMVRVVGVEPTLCCQNRILSPARLPIPPHPRGHLRPPNQLHSGRSRKSSS